MTTVAPSCPISDSQVPYRHRLLRAGALQGAPTPIPAIPPASDLPSLIRTVNILRDVLRQLTTSLTVNNVYNPPPPFARAKGNTYYSEYPAWDETGIGIVKGYVFHRDGDKVDDTQRAFVRRINQVAYQNRTQEDPDFYWAYNRPLDQQVK